MVKYLKIVKYQKYVEWSMSQEMVKYEDLIGWTEKTTRIGKML